MAKPETAGGAPFLERVAALPSSEAARQAFTRYVQPSSLPREVPLQGALYRALADHLLRWYGLPATPAAAAWEWAPLYRLEREIDPHYFGPREIAERLGQCPPLPPDTRAELADILTRYFQWRQGGLEQLGAQPLVNHDAAERWQRLFPPRFAWRCLDVLKAVGFYPAGSAGGYRAQQRFERGVFEPAWSATGWREWIELCEAPSGAAGGGAHGWDFVAGAFAGEWTALGVEGPCGPEPLCDRCPLAADCAWARGKERPVRSVAEAAARLRMSGPGGLDEGTLLHALFGLDPAQAAAWRERLERTGLRALAGRSLPELEAWLKGGDPGAERLSALLELAKRLADERMLPGETFRGARDVFNHFRMRLRDSKQEQFLLIMLDSRRRFQGEVEVSKGTMERALVHPRDVFTVPIREQASAVVVVHNHPSGDPSPSPEDINLTQQLVKIGELVGIPVIDHVVIGDERFVSMAERGLLNFP
ncbi:MAG: hypothetical protein O7D96_09605 [SAR324 cluster bacterium]|nr:hypothetical protein [SAR324 cluster bacterium]